VVMTRVWGRGQKMISGRHFSLAIHLLSCMLPLFFYISSFYVAHRSTHFSRTDYSHSPGSLHFLYFSFLNSWLLLLPSESEHCKYICLLSNLIFFWPLSLIDIENKLSSPGLVGAIHTPRQWSLQSVAHPTRYLTHQQSPPSVQDGS